MNIGVTGHQKLDGSDRWEWIRLCIRQLLSAQARPINGITSLAAGADQVFARLVLDAGGSLHVIIPFEGYERTFEHDSDVREYRALLSAASRVEVLPTQADDEKAFYAAGIQVVSLSDLLVAIWDGQPAKGFGGTADIVRHARQHNVRVWHVNPVARTTN